MSTRITFDITVGRSFPAFIRRINEDGLRSAQVLKHEAEELGLQGKDIAEYVTRQQTLDREERSAWRATQKRQVETRMAELQAEEKEGRQDTSRKEKGADDIKIQLAKIEADKELTLKEMKLQAQAEAQASTSPAATPPS